MSLPKYTELDMEQLEVYALPLDTNVLVSGPPGTGKSVMAVHRCRLLSDSDDFDDVKLLCYNHTLIEYTRQWLSQLGLDPDVNQQWMAWLGRLYKASTGKWGLPTVDPENAYVFDWAQILVDMDSNKVQDLVPSCLIVDEGQDLPPEFYRLIRKLVGHMAVFADENQVLNKQNSTLAEIHKALGAGAASRRLTRNYRNTVEIARFASCFHTDLASGVADLPESSGDRPSLERIATRADMVMRIARHANNNSDSRVGVLLPTAPMRKEYYEGLKDRVTGAIQTYDYRMRPKPTLDFVGAGVSVLTYASAKGLEFETVFLPEIECFDAAPGIPDYKMAMFVMTSRARRQLIMLTTNRGVPDILRDVDPSLVDWPDHE